VSERRLDARLVVPALPPRHISRPRLLAELDRAAAKPLILVAAGPGAGKTVLLSDWVTRTQAPVAWITVSPADAEPLRFWRLLRAALQACGQPVQALPAVTPHGDTIERVQALLGSLPAVPVPPVLIIDDAHLLTHPDVLADLDTVIRSGVPPRVRLVLATRSDPLLPLHRYRLAGQMSELRARELAMTRAETQQLLATHGVMLADDDLDVLVARTEGWAAGTRLSAMRMENTEYPALFVSELALGQGSIGEYLMAEVLDHQPEPVRRVLTETSLFDEVTGPLSDAVTGMHGCAEILSGLAASNSFVIPVDATRTRFRYHQLLREILRHSLHRREATVVPHLMRRAAAYFQRSGESSKALSWAAKAGDRPYAASLLIQGGLAHAFVHGEDLSGLGLNRWQPPVRAGDGSGQAREAAIASLAIAAITGGTEFAAPEDQGADGSAQTQPASPNLVVTADLARFIVGLKAGDDQAVTAAAERLLTRQADVPESLMPGLPAAVLLAQAGTLFWHGRIDEASALVVVASAEARQHAPPVVELKATALNALIDSLQSRPRHALDATRRAHALLHKHGDLSVHPALELAAATRLMMAADLAGAARALQRTHISDTVDGDPGLVAARDIGQATLLLASGKVNEARFIAHALSAEAELPLPRALRKTLLADAETMLGRPNTALDLLQDYHDSDIAILTALPRARAYLSLHDLRNAQHCVRTALTATSPLISRYLLVEAMLCEAHIAMLNGEAGSALGTIVAATELAQDDIILPFFVTQGFFAPLLAHHPAVAAGWPGPAQGKPITMITGSERFPGINLADPLTEREQAVLRFLTTSKSNTEIADEMCLSANTVKSHLAAIYRKLAVSRRKEAVMRARELELL
jgi:LuxR family transcriptional regulator, maltose regulon positive regulatory protein